MLTQHTHPIYQSRARLVCHNLYNNTHTQGVDPL